MMRNILTAFMTVILLVGCRSQMDVNDENLTIFGRLSELVELGDTEETVAYKLPVGDEFLVTIHAEVLHTQPASLNLTIIEEESGVMRDDLIVRLQLCNAVDPDQNAQCGDDIPMDVHDFVIEAVDGTYTSETFEWELPGGWHTVMMIEDDSGVELATTTFWTSVYPERPPSSNAFELFNISLPFVVIGLFLLAGRLWKWGWMRPADLIIDNNRQA